MANPYQPGYPAPQPPGWGVPPNYPGAQPFSRTEPPRNRAAVDIVAGIALAVAAILAAAQSVWGLVVSGGGYSVFEHGFGAALIPFWVCSLVALVGGILLSVAGSGSIRIRTVAALGGGALFVTVTQNLVVLCLDSYVRLADRGNWLAIPAAIAILAAVGSLIAAKPGSSATPVSPSAIPGYLGAASYPGPAVHPGAQAGYPAPAVAAAPESALPIPAPYGWPSYPGAAVPGYPGIPAPAYPGAPGYPPAPSGSPGDPNAAGPQPGYPSSPEQRGGPESSSAPTVHAGPSGAPPSEPHLPQQ